MSVSEFNDPDQPERGVTAPFDDVSAEFGQEFIDAVKRRDTRFSLIEIGIAIDHELNHSVVIKTLISKMVHDSEKALEDLVECSPADPVAVSKHIVKIRALIYIRKVLDIVRRAGRNAEQAIRAEDGIGSHEERD